MMDVYPAIKKDCYGYQGVTVEVPVSELLDVVVFKEYDPANRKLKGNGYYTPLKDSALKRMSKELSSGQKPTRELLLPPFFAVCREPYRDFFNSKNRTVSLHGKKLSIVDGRARLCALRKALGNESLQSGWLSRSNTVSLNVVFLGSDLEELLLYTGLQARYSKSSLSAAMLLLAKHDALLLGLSSSPKRLEMVVRELVGEAMATDKDSPLRLRLALPGERLTSKRKVGSVPPGKPLPGTCYCHASSYAKSFGHVFRDVWGEMESREAMKERHKKDSVPGLVREFSLAQKQYWGAVSRLHSHIFEAPNDYILLQSGGISVLNRVSARLSRFLAESDRPLDREGFSSLLRRSPTFMDESFWSRDPMAGDAGKYGGEKGYDAMASIILGEILGLMA